MEEEEEQEKEEKQQQEKPQCKLTVYGKVNVVYACTNH